MIRRILIGETKKNRTISFTSAPNNLAYGTTGTVTAVPSEGVGDGTITYSSSDTSVASISGTTISATGVGTCTITAYISEGSSYHEASTTYTFTCIKADPVYTAPTAKSGLVYNGSPQELITAGSTNDGTMMYSIDNGGTWTTSVPSKTDGGTYYIYWKIVGDNNHNDKSALTFAAIINRADRTISFTSTPNNIEKGATDTVSASPSVGTDAVSYRSSNSTIVSIGQYTGVITVYNAGTATITASVSLNTNYNGASCSYTITCTNIYNGHAYVDFGLPSGTKWATMNVGASSETGSGNYYMYGKGSTNYNSNHPIYTGTENPLLTSKDTASLVWGGQWHTPTKALFDELSSRATITRITSDGNYCLLISLNGKTILLPAAGLYLNGTKDSFNTLGAYWTSTPDGSYYAQRYIWNSAYKSTISFSREAGCSIRGVVG